MPRLFHYAQSPSKTEKLMTKDTVFMRRNDLTVLGLAAGGLGTIGLTIAGYFTFIPPWHHTLTCKAALISSCFAEAILYLFLAYALTAPRLRGQPDAAPRIQTSSLVAIWALLIVGSSAWAARPSQANTWFSDQILFFQAAITLLAFMGAFFFNRQAAMVEESQAGPQAARNQVRSLALTLDELLGIVRSAGPANAGSATALDQLARKLDLVKSQLQAAPPAQGGLPSLPAVSSGELTELIARLESEVRGLRAASAEGLHEHILKASEVAEQTAQALRRRQAAGSL
jgi:HPt (histidine-containing phosphotransfer) domain-containing protein